MGVPFYSSLFTQSGTFIRYAIADPCLYEICRIVCGKLEMDAKERWEQLTGDSS